MTLQPVGPVYLVERFPPLHRELMTLLRGLTPAEWSRPTACAAWSVKDIVAHLLDTGLRRLSLDRDRFSPPPADISSYADLVAYLNGLNAEWVTAARRLSTQVLMDLMDLMSVQLHEYFASLDPHAEARFGVAWAGEKSSPVWFDIGREYTERWLHQQQIREATGAPGLLAPEWLHPTLDVFIRALPYTYKGVDAPAGQRIGFEIRGEAGGAWTLVRQSDTWELFVGLDRGSAAWIGLDQETAWKLFSKGLPEAAARERIDIRGDHRLADRIFGALAVMA